jgi:hypothetical protein
LVTRLTHLVTVVMLAVLAGGCANQTPEGGAVEEQQVTLAARPTIDEITARYERMQAELRQRLVSEIGISEWVKRSELTGSGCGDFPDLPNAESRSLGNWFSEGNLPDARWSQAQAIVTEVTGRYGFAPDFIVNRPGSHTIIGIDQYGASYDFGTGKNTTLGVSTGCHLNPPDSPPP